MKARLTPAILTAAAALAACTPAPRTPMAGTAAGAGADPLSLAARERAGAGCPDASRGVASLSTTGAGHPDVAYAGRAAGAGAGDPSRRLEPGGERGGHSCP